MSSRRELLNTLTKQELVDFAKRNGLDISITNTKTGIISRIMSELTAEKILNNLQSRLN